MIFKDHRNRLLLNEYYPVILTKGYAFPTEIEADKAASPWVNHIYLLVEDKTHAETIFDWFAYLIQEPQERPMFSLLITSEVRGCGKDTITDIFQKC